MSLVESVANIMVGFAVAVITQLLVFPLFGLAASLSDNLIIGLIFTAVSLCRSHGLRRFFNAVNERMKPACAAGFCATGLSAFK
jgi:hypothetical protein